MRMVQSQTGRKLGSVPSLSKFEVTSAIGKAEAASQAFNKSSIHERKVILQSLQDWLLSESETLCQMAARDTGKTSSYPKSCLNPHPQNNSSCYDAVLDAFLGEILVTAEKIRWILANLDNVLADEYRS